jgi:hypothetical protein
MSIGNRQIGWSQESNLLWEISKQLDRAIAVLCTGPCPTTTTTTTTSASCDCRPGLLISSTYNYFDCQGVNKICNGTGCRGVQNPCFDITKPYTGIDINVEAPWICRGCS